MQDIHVLPLGLQLIAQTDCLQPKSVEVLITQTDCLQPKSVEVLITQTDCLQPKSVEAPIILTDEAAPPLGAAFTAIKALPF
jgi:hypothetical protein